MALVNEADTGAGSRKILSISDIVETRDEIIAFNTQMNTYIECLERIVSLFNSEGIVQSFYESGNYGAEVKEQFGKLLNSFVKYREITNDISSQTNKFLNTQLELNRTGGGR